MTSKYLALDLGLDYSGPSASTCCWRWRWQIHSTATQY